MSASRPGRVLDQTMSQQGQAETTVRFPEVHVCVHTGHPLALVSAVRYALRRAGVDREQISTFSGQDLASHSGRQARRVCNQWVTVDAPAA